MKRNDWQKWAEVAKEEINPLNNKKTWILDDKKSDNKLKSCK